ncbi:MAG: hypothetical protein R6W90_15410 [Ignavibacteriaceae bacterium]
MKKLLIIFIPLVFMSSLLKAQVLADSLEYITLRTPVNLLSTRLDKQINTYNLNSKFGYYNNFGKISLRVLENYNSTFISTAEKNIRDEQYFLISSAYKITSRLEAGFSGSSSILSDNRQIEINQASVSNASVYFIVNPYENMFIAPFAGYSNNRQIGENNYGFVYGAEGTMNDFTQPDLSFSSEFRFKNEDISPRKNNLRNLKASVINIFNEDVSNSIRASLSETRKDFYYEADSLTSAQFNVTNNIQSRTETSYFVQDGLRINNFLSAFNQELLGGITWRNIERDTRYRSKSATSASIFDTRINELRFEFESNTYYSSKSFSGNLRMNYAERDEKHITRRFEGANEIFYEERSRLESSKNNNSSRVSISLSGNVYFSQSDRLSFSLFQNKLRYDTPSESNFDDRDELLSIARIRYSKMLTPFLEAFVNAEGTYSHVVYIFAERSSNNNVNRVINFSSGGNYRGKNFTSLNNFGVSANYTVYDFEALNPDYHSFSFRQLNAADSTIIKINNRLSFVFYGYIKLSEQGDFKWTSFATRPTRFIEEIYTEPKLVFNLNKLFVSAGMRVFSINTYNYKGKDKQIDTKYLSTGPLAEVFLSLQDSLYLRFYGWYEFITVRNNPERELINFNFQMNWNF